MVKLKWFLFLVSALSILYSFYLFYYLPKNRLASKEILGKYLFFDTRLSLNNTKSCASCHNPTFAFTDGYRRSGTALGENTLHNAPSLMNISLQKKFDWANPNINTLQLQMQRPLYSNHPIELGTDKKLEYLTQLFKKDSIYKLLVDKAFVNSDKLNTKTIIEESIVAFEKSLISFNSKYDQYLSGNHKTFNSSELRGMKLFFSSQLKCSQCHIPPHFTKAAFDSKNIFENIGLYNVSNSNKYPIDDYGIALLTKRESDNGKYKTPSLRNIMVTNPYMHDGSVATIEEVIDIYSRGGRDITYGDSKGDGSINIYKSKLIMGFQISKEQKMDLINFLSTLTDSTIFNNPKFKKPDITEH